MYNEPLTFINRTDALRELDQLIMSRPLEPERRLINMCKKRLMELPIIHSAQIPPKKFKKCPRCGYEEKHHGHSRPKSSDEDKLVSYKGDVLR